MTSYKIFDLLCADVSQKFMLENRIITYKPIVGKQRIRIHILNQTNEDINSVEVLDFLNRLQQNCVTIHTGIDFISVVFVIKTLQNLNF